MKLKLRSRSENAPETASTSFKNLVKEAVEVTRTLNALTGTKAQRLSADAFLAETLALEDSSVNRVTQLRAALENNSTSGLSHTRATLRRMLTALRGPNFPRPPKDSGRLKFLTTDAATAELIQLGYSTVELLGVAVSITAERHPELFGEQESSNGLDDQVATLRKRQSMLFEKISTSWTAADLHIGDRNPQGHSVASFKLSDGEVPVAPPNDAGERLIKYLVARNRAS